jgi:hypothetical protein
MENHIICGVHITDRAKNAKRVQELFTEYGCNIRTRLGLHDVHKDACSPNGMIVLELTGDKKAIAALTEKLRAISGVQVQQIEFQHD